MQRAKRTRLEITEEEKKAPSPVGDRWLQLLMPWKSTATSENIHPQNEQIDLPPIPEFTDSGAPSFTTLTNYADQTLGAHIIFATDEFNCTAANILVDSHSLTWTTRRRRIPGYDWCVIKLPIPILIRGVELHTTDSAPPHISLEAGLDVHGLASTDFPDYIPRAADKGCLSAGTLGHALELQKAANKIVESSATWRNVIEVTPVKKNQINYFEVLTDDSVSSELKVDLIRLNVLPDGGIASLKIFGECSLNLGPLHRLKEREEKTRTLDYAALTNGGQVCYASSGAETAQLLLLPASIKNDGFWITPRQPLRPMFVQQSGGNSELRFSGSEHVVIALAARCIVSAVDISTSGNHGDLPYKIHLSMFDSSRVRMLPMLRQQLLFSSYPERVQWFEFGTLEDLGGDEEYTVTLNTPIPATHLRVEMVPDGGVTRVRVHGNYCDFGDS